jgi:hypothetical protein
MAPWRRIALSVSELNTVDNLWARADPVAIVMQAWPELQLRLVGGAGHSQYHPAIQHELLEATDAMRNMAWTRPSPQLQVAVY